jgi:hypothetical protein
MRKFRGIEEKELLSDTVEEKLSRVRKILIFSLNISHLQVFVFSN